MERFMDFRENSDNDLDIQALLNKYLPDEDTVVIEEVNDSVTEEPAGFSDSAFIGLVEPEKDGDADSALTGEKIFAVSAAVSDSAAASEVSPVSPVNEENYFEETAKDTYVNDDPDGFYITGLFDGDEAEANGNSADISFDGDVDVFDAPVTGGDSGDSYIDSQVSPLEDGESYDDVTDVSLEAESDEGFYERSFDEVTGDGDDSSLSEGFVVDEQLIAELLAADDVQFGGIEGFEDIESLSGYVNEEARPKEDVTYSTEVSEEIPKEETPADDSEEFEHHSFDGDISNEDEYAEFVNASLSELDSDLTPEKDIDLMVAFGLEDELKKQVGAKKASRIAKNYEARALEREAEEKRSVRGEYRDPAQTKEFSERYRKAYRESKIRLAVSCVLMLLLLIFENLPVIGYQMAGPFDPAIFPVVYVMADLQILLLCYAVSYNELFTGFAGIFKLKPTPESILSISALVSVVHTVYAAVTAVTPVEPRLFNFPSAFCAFMALVFSYLNLKREIFSFNVVSSKKQKYALRRLSGDEAALEAAAFEDDGDVGDVLKIEKTSFVDGYVFRTQSRDATTPAVMLMCILLSASLAVIFGAFAKLVGRLSTQEALALAHAAFSLALPVTSLVSFSYPFYKANCDSYEDDSTIVGECSLEEYSGASVISFGDDLVFPSVGVKVQNIKVYNNYRFDRVLYYAASVFTKTQGPLSDVFELATLEMGYSDDVVLTSIGEGYITCDVNGKSITFGKGSVLTSQGFEIPEQILEEDRALPEDISVMYMIFKNKIVAKMHISYALDEDFEYTVKQLAGSGLSVCVRTFDPNIDEDMIRSKLALDKYPMRVVRGADFADASAEVPRADSGIVARGTPKALLKAVTYCDRVLDVKKSGSFISLIAAVISVMILALVLITGKSGYFASLYVVLIQLFWLIPVMLTAKTSLR